MDRQRRESVKGKGYEFNHNDRVTGSSVNSTTSTRIEVVPMPHHPAVENELNSIEVEEDLGRFTSYSDRVYCIATDLYKQLS